MNKMSQKSEKNKGKYYIYSLKLKPCKILTEFVIPVSQSPQSFSFEWKLLLISYIKT